MMLKLSKAGYGSLNELKEWSAREVLQALNYEKFLGDYESSFLELNKHDTG